MPDFLGPTSAIANEGRSCPFFFVFAFLAFGGTQGVEQTCVEFRNIRVYFCDRRILSILPMFSGFINSVWSEESENAGRDPENKHILPKLLLTLFLAIFTIRLRRLNRKGFLVFLATTPGSRGYLY
jgi:hypothetical protein